MSNLRSLLPAYADYTTPDMTNRVAPISRLKTGQELVFVGMCAVTYDNNYCRNALCCWVVPAGVTRLTFEIWGGGGGGAGSCCCSWGIPGGAGAYARKTVCSTTMGGLAGCAYQLFPGYPTCCAPTMGCGFQGCTTYITGYGLSNFCAEGGKPGCSYCWPFYPYQCNPIFTGKCQAGWSQGFSCCWYGQWCACYFGADYGAPGCTGFLYTDSCSNNACQYKHIFPLASHTPGINGAAGQTYIAGRICDANQPGAWDSCHFANGVIGGQWLRTPGSGGATAAACAGNCYCGASGGPGMIRISMSYDTVCVR